MSSTFKHGIILLICNNIVQYLPLVSNNWNKYFIIVITDYCSIILDKSMLKINYE